MASLTFANWRTVEAKAAYRIKTIADAVVAVKAGTAALQTALDGINDDTGIAAKFRATMEVADDLLDNLENKAIETIAADIEALWAAQATTPKDGSGDAIAYTFNAWVTSQKSGDTNPLLSNEITRTFRRKNGDNALSAANCSGATETSYGTSTVTGATTVTNVLVTAPVDTDLYAGGLLEAYVTNQFGSETTFTLTGVDLNGSPWTGSVVIANGAEVGSTHVVVPTIAKTYAVKLTNVTVAGGTASDAVTWRIRAPLTIAA